MPIKLNPFTCKPDMVMLPGGGTAVIDIEVDANTAPGTDPVVPDGGGTLTISGAAVAAHSVPVETHSRAANAFNVEVQVASAVTGAPGNTNAAGLVQFDDTSFAVDADGYVTLVGGGMAIDTFTTDVAGPVSPNGSGEVDVTGTSVFSDGTTANTLTLNVQATANTFLVGAGAGTTATELGPLTNGQLIIGSTGVAPVAATLTAGTGISISNGAGSVTIDAAAATPLSFPTDSGTATPAANALNILGGTSAAGTTPVATTGVGDTVTTNVQISQALAATDATKIGLCNFDSAAFGVDANGFVTLAGGGTATIEFIPDSGTSPVVPNGSGQVTLTGGTAAAGTTPVSVVGGTNTATTTIQLSQALAATDATKVGLCNFDSGFFSVDANGFVTASGGGGFNWIEVTGTSDDLEASKGFIANNAGLVTLTLPSTCAVGDVTRVAGLGAGGWTVAQNASQTIHFGSSDTTTGIGGSLSSTNRYDAVELLCVATNTDFVVLSSIGNLTVV